MSGSETLQYAGRNNSNDSLTEHCAISRILVVPKEAQIAIHVFTLVVALIGNSLLIVAYKRMKEPVMLLIANMAASDFLTGIFLLPRLITIAIIDSLAWQVQGLGGTILCKMCTFLSDISLSVSTQSSVIIAVERFIAVVRPLKVHYITARIRRRLVASTWIAAIAFHLPYLYLMELMEIKNSNNVTICHNKWETDNKPAFLRYNIFLYATVLFIPLIVISIVYPITVVYIRRDKMAAHRCSKGGRERKTKLFQLAAATILSLTICWSSYSVVTFLRLFAPDTLLKCSLIFVVIESISRVLATSYCAVNPFICFIFLRKFRGELGIICKCQTRKASTSCSSAKFIETIPIHRTAIHALL